MTIRSHIPKSPWSARSPTGAAAGSGSSNTSPSCAAVSLRLGGLLELEVPDTESLKEVLNITRVLWVPRGEEARRADFVAGDENELTPAGSVSDEFMPDRRRSASTLSIAIAATKRTQDLPQNSRPITAVPSRYVGTHSAFWSWVYALVTLSIDSSTHIARLLSAGAV